MRFRYEFPLQPNSRGRLFQRLSVRILRAGFFYSYVSERRKAMRVEFKGCFSPDLNEPELPADPTCCAVFMSADFGVLGEEGADQFNFHVVIPQFLSLHPEVRWGRGYLLMPELSWPEVHRMLGRLASVTAKDWPDAAAKLGRFLEWEFDDYQH